MLVFLDFEASSLGKHSYPIEVAWVFADGPCEAHLIRPAPDWTEWDSASEAVHGIARGLLLTDGEPHDGVARRMVERLAGHDLLASAPSWDGKWLSVRRRCLRTNRFQDHVDTVRRCQSPSATARRGAGQALATLADAMTERQRWRTAMAAARELAGG